MTYETRGEVKKWMRSTIDESEIVSTRSLAQEAINHFRNDPQFVQAFLDEGLYPLMHKCASEIMSSTRGVITPGVVQSGHVRMTREEIKRKANSLSKFLTWREYVPDRNGHVKLVDMTRLDLLSAAQERRNRSQSELTMATFEETLASRMTDDTALVGDVFSGDELDGIFSALKAGEG